jgi:RNA polymerase sigma-54 factor
MAIKLVKTFKQSQILAMTPSLRKSIELLQLSKFELLEEIKHHLDENPFIKNINETKEFFELDYENFSEEINLQEHLLKQIFDLSLEKEDEEICKTLIYSLDENGMLIDELEELEDILEFKHSQTKILENLINVVQKLNPLGVGARDFKEMIKIQVDKKVSDIEVKEIADAILVRSENSNFQELENELSKNFDDKKIRDAINFIKKCDLSPGMNFSKNEFIRPDIVVSRANTSLEIKLIENDMPSLEFDVELYETFKKEKSVSENIKDKVHEAKWFIKAVETRNKNVSKIGSLICEKQIKFLTKNSIDPEPLSGKEIAKELSLSTSTVSRIIRASNINLVLPAT